MDQADLEAKTYNKLQAPLWRGEKKHRCQMQEKVQVAFDARKFEQ